ncbi:MAG: methyltransferase domain-containing protein [Thaumarchaeota archaeon]|nr:methyltransferase domain-containing protein [Nitrososphaerota archaeon]
MSTDNMAEYFSGRKLFGDDFSSEDVMRWHEEERNAYYSLGEQTEHEYNYSYHSLNWTYGFKYLGSRYYHNALGLGSAYADGVLPILGQIEHLTIIEPAVGFTRTSIRDVQVDYVEPTYDGTLFFPDSSFDLITCLGVLHHIPNVTHVVMELHRCLKKGGFLLLREPVVSMGDWRKPRAGLTKRERGIPERILEEIILGSGLTIVKQSKCMFSLTSRLRLFMKGPVYNSGFLKCATIT